MIIRPAVVKVFAQKSTMSGYMPVEFGTNKPANKKKLDTLANKAFDKGFEAIDSVQLRDFTSVFFYQSALLKYLFTYGIPEYSAFENYPLGAVVNYKGEVYIALKPITATKTGCECDPNTCNPEDAQELSQENWSKFLTYKEFEQTVQELKTNQKNINQNIIDMKGVIGFEIEEDNEHENALALTLTLAGNKKVRIPMTAFSKASMDINGVLNVRNADGTSVVINPHAATIRVTDSSNNTLGYVHATVYTDEHTHDSTVKVLATTDLDESKGFYFNTQQNKWEIRLNDVLKEYGGLQWEQGELSVKVDDLLVNNGGISQHEGKLYLKMSDIVKLNGGLVVDDQGRVSVNLLDLTDTNQFKLNNVSQKVELNSIGLEALINEISANSGSKIKHNAEGLTGNGTAASTLKLNLSRQLKINTNKQLEINLANVIGDGLEVRDGKIHVKTVPMVDTTGTTLGHLVEKVNE